MYSKPILKLIKNAECVLCGIMSHVELYNPSKKTNEAIYIFRIRTVNPFSETPE